MTARIALPVVACIGAAVVTLLLTHRSRPATRATSVNRYCSDDQSSAVPIAVMMAAAVI